MKNWYQSKTLWTNIGLIITAIGAVFTGETTWAVSMPVIITNIVNIGLRFTTTTAIGTPEQ